MDSCAQFMLKSSIITFCEEECWPRIVQRAESKCGIETLGERYRNNLLINFISVWPVRRKQEHLLAKTSSDQTPIKLICLPVGYFDNAFWPRGWFYIVTSSVRYLDYNNRQHRKRRCQFKVVLLAWPNHITNKCDCFYRNCILQITWPSLK